MNFYKGKVSIISFIISGALLVGLLLYVSNTIRVCRLDIMKTKVGPGFYITDWDNSIIKKDFDRCLNRHILPSLDIFNNYWRNIKY